MAKNIFIGVNNVAKKPKNIYVGVNGVARKVKAAYVGVNGVARKVWPNSNIPDDGYQEVTWLGGGVNTNINSYVYPRIFMQVSFPQDPTGFFYTNKLFHGRCWNTNTSRYYTCSCTNSEGFRFEDYYDNTDDYSTISGVLYKTYEHSSESILLNKKYIVDYSNNKKTYLYCESGYYANSSHNFLFNNISQTPSYTSGFKIAFLCYWGGGGSEQPSGTFTKLVRVHYIDLISGNTYLRRLVPCYRKSDEILGYYDLANNIFLAAGNGNNKKSNYEDYVGPDV